MSGKNCSTCLRHLFLVNNCSVYFSKDCEHFNMFKSRDDKHCVFLRGCQLINENVILADL